MLIPHIPHGTNLLCCYDDLSDLNMESDDYVLSFELTDAELSEEDIESGTLGTFNSTDIYWYAVKQFDGIPIDALIMPVSGRFYVYLGETEITSLSITSEYISDIQLEAGTRPTSYKECPVDLCAIVGTAIVDTSILCE